MRRMKEYIHRFIIDEEGTATIEWIIVLAVVCGFVAVVIALQGNVKDKVNEVGDMINGISIPQE